MFFKRLFIAYCYVCFPILGIGQSNTSTNAIFAGMGGASAVSNNLWSIQQNTAGLSSIEQPQVGLSVSNLYNQPSFTTLGVAFVQPGKYGSTGLHISRFGDQLYNESLLTLGHAHSIDFVQLGGSIDLLQLSIDELGSQRNVLLNFGGIIELSPELQLGAHIKNFTRTSLNQYADERYLTSMKTGLCYTPISTLQLLLEAEKNTVQRTFMRMGMEYEVSPHFYVRTGFTTLRNQVSFGFGIHRGSFSFDYGVQSQPLLGLSNYMSIQYAVRKKKPPISP